MIGKIINYGTDAVLPEKYRFIGDYACAVVDGATGDYASAAVLTAEGISENLKQTGNKNAALVADVTKAGAEVASGDYASAAATASKGLSENFKQKGNKDAALVADITGSAVSVASGDINKAIKEDSTSSLVSAGLKMGAVGGAAGVGRALDGNEGARIATTLSANSIGEDLKQTAIKTGITASGATSGYIIKGKEGIGKGSNLSKGTSTTINDSINTFSKDEIEIGDLKRLKQDAVLDVKNTKDFVETEPKNRHQLREKIREDQKFTLVDKSSDALFTAGELATDNQVNEKSKDELVFDLISELGKAGNAACKIREQKVEVDNKVYKSIDAVCYITGNYSKIKAEIKNDKE